MPLLCNVAFGYPVSSAVAMMLEFRKHNKIYYYYISWVDIFRKQNTKQLGSGQAFGRLFSFLTDLL